MRTELISQSRGFIALTSVLIIAFSLLSFSMLTLGAAADYRESVLRHEMRIQAALNAEGCRQSAKLMRAKDIFADGEVGIPDLGCVVSFERSLEAPLVPTIHGTSTLWGVSRSF